MALVPATHSPMTADDPYRWAQALLASGQSGDEVKQTLVQAGVDAELAAETVAAVLRQRPRVNVLKVAFGVALLEMSVLSTFVFFSPVLLALLVGGSLFMTWDGIRGR